MVTAQAEADPQGTRTIPLAGMTATLTNIAYGGPFCKWVSPTIRAYFHPGIHKRPASFAGGGLLAHLCGTSLTLDPAIH